MYQCLGHLGKGHITGDPVGVWSGDSGLLYLYRLRGVFRKKCDSLLVETDIFCHFRGLILCNTKRYQYHLIEKQEHMGTVQHVFYSPMSYFFKLMELLLPFASPICFVITTALLSFLMVAG